DDARDAEVPQVIAHSPARSEHRVEPLVQSAHIAPDERLGERTADAAAADLRDVRVIETHHRDAAALRDLPGAPRRMERIARLDERRLERIEDPRRGARASEGRAGS